MKPHSLLSREKARDEGWCVPRDSQWTDLRCSAGKTNPKQFLGNKNLGRPRSVAAQQLCGRAPAGDEHTEGYKGKALGILSAVENIPSHTFFLHQVLLP